MKKSLLMGLLAGAVTFAALQGAAHAQQPGNKELDEGIAQWKAMLAEGNPADLDEVKGEALWNKARGPKNAALKDGCDLGLGVGVVKGAYVTLPRFFKDTARVQDLESRLMTCMEQVQGLDPKTVVDGQFLKGERASMASLVTYIAAASKGLPLNVPQKHPEEKRFYKMGKELFYFRGGPMDFSCATCHGAEGKRIRASALPDLRQNKSTGEAYTGWPAYRVSNAQLWTMQHRLNDCFRQQRFPEPIYGSDVTIALSSYLGVTGKGVGSVAPGIKR